MSRRTDEQEYDIVIHDSANYKRTAMKIILISFGVIAGLLVIILPIVFTTDRDITTTLSLITTTGKTTTTTTTRKPVEIKSFIVLETDPKGYKYYSMNNLGEKTMKNYNFPNYDNRYLERTGGAILRGQFYVFGGAMDKKWIGVLDKCTFRTLNVKLLILQSSNNNLLTLKDDSKVLICFSSAENKTCQSFDGNRVVIEPQKTFFSHNGGCIGYFGNDILAVGSKSDDKRKVERQDARTLQWSLAPSLPIEYTHNGNTCIGFDDALFSIAEEQFGWSGGRRVFLFKNNQWRVVGTLTEQHWWGTAIRLGYDVFTLSNEQLIETFTYDPYEPLETYKLDAKVLSGAATSGWKGMMFDAKYDYCV